MTAAQPARPGRPGRPPRRTGRRAGRGKAEVLAAAGQVIALRGADATRFSDVSQASATPVGTLQYLFGSKDDMLIAAFRHASAAEQAALRDLVAGTSDPWRQLERIADAALGLLDRDWVQPAELWIECWRYALRDEEMRPDVLADYRTWRALIAGTVRAGMASGQFAAGLDPDAVAIQAVALLDGIIIPLRLGDAAVPAQTARALVLDALAALVSPGRRDAPRG